MTCASIRDGTAATTRSSRTGCARRLGICWWSEAFRRCGRGKIRAPLMLINFQEDFWNPAELGVAEQEIKKVRNAELVLLPFSDQARGHYTFFQASLWQQHLARFLGKLKP